MDCKIIACETLLDELNLALRETGCRYPVTWVEAEYHIDPDKLRIKLQQEIDAVTGADALLFAYGCCGNGLVGLKATTADLIIPKTDDCISMVLSEPGQAFERMKETYFLTKGWLQSPKGLLEEYRHTLERYGEKRAGRIFALMLKHYRHLMMIDTKAYDLEEWVDKARELARLTRLELSVTEGGVCFLKRLLTGPYDENFCVVKKGAAVGITHFLDQRRVAPRQVI